MTAIESPNIIHVVTDYGADNAVNEVIPKLRKYFGFGSVEILNTAIANFNTVNNAFWIAQLALTAELPTLIYHNVAPRKDDTHARQDNRGEQLLGIRLDNGVVVVGPNSGYSLALLHGHIVECSEIFVGGKSQFRSRDVFVEPAALFWRNDPYLETVDVDPALIIPTLDNHVVLHIDNYGNIKTSYTEIDAEPGDHVIVRIGTWTAQAVVAGGAFQQEEGTLGFVPGSSGWDSPLYEVFYRGGRADTAIHEADGASAPVNAIAPGDVISVEKVTTSSKHSSTS
jgi:hypothetical protein